MLTRIPVYRSEDDKKAETDSIDDTVFLPRTGPLPHQTEHIDMASIMYGVMALYDKAREIYKRHLRP